MADVLLVGRFGSRALSKHDAGDLVRRLELIEDRPDAVLTWADIARYTRALRSRIKSTVK